jgi:flagellar biosynthetic protein FliQ
MTLEFVTGFFFEAIKTTMFLAAPMLLAGLAVGLLVSIFQAATSISEMIMIVFMENLFNNLSLYIH